MAKKKGHIHVEGTHNVFDGSSAYHINPYANLWKAVIAQHIQDLTSKAKASHARAARIEAHYFFFGNTDALQMACDFAGYCVDEVVRAAGMALEAGKSYRAEARRGARYLEYQQRRDGAWRPRKKTR